MFTVPPFSVDKVFTIRSEVVDWSLDLLGIPQLWKCTKGNGIKVAILDTGVVMEHPDLVNAVADHIDFTGSSSGINDVVGHGTAVCGIVGARENNSGVIGVAPCCSILMAKVLGDDGCSDHKPIVAGLKWAVERGANVICMSFGTTEDIRQLHREITRAAKSCVLIAAAGNSGPRLNTIDYPAIYDECISVGAICRDMSIAPFSSRGSKVDIVAPGDDILSCYPPTGMARLSGTSFAAPMVAGVIALMLATGKYATKDDIIKELYNNTIDLGTPGQDKHFGRGLINPNHLITVSGSNMVAMDTDPDYGLL